MTDEINDEVVDLVFKRIEVKLEPYFKGVHEKIDTLQKTLDIMSDNVSQDRTDLSQIRVATAAIEQASKELISLQNVGQKRFVKIVVEQTEELMDDASQKIAEQVEPAILNAIKKIRKGIPLLASRPWWKFWKGSV